MQITIAQALDLIMPGANWTGSLTDDTQESYDALGWHDSRAKPAWSDVLSQAQSGLPVKILAVKLAVAATTAADTITKQIIPDQTRQAAYTNAMALVGAGGTVPTIDPAKTAFASLATVYGFGANLSGFASLVIDVAATSLTLSAALATLQGAALTAKNASDLAAALTAFEATIEGLVMNLNEAGLVITVTAPPAITIPGINA